MPYSDQDIAVILDLSGAVSATGSQIAQSVDTAVAADQRGLILYGDNGNGGAFEFPLAGPDTVTYPRLVRYLWIHKTSKIIRKWSGSAWIVIGVVPDDGSVTTVKLADGSVTAIKIADGSITSAKLAPGSVTADKVNFSTEIPFSFFDIIIKSREVDPRAFGADPDGVTDSEVAIRKAIFYANANEGVVKFKAGLYIIGRDVAYDGTQESLPFLHGTDLAYRDKPMSVIPLLDNTILTSDGNAILQTKVVSDAAVGLCLFGGMGRENIIVENLIFDGNMSLQPNRGATYDRYGGLGDQVLFLGNKSVVRNNTFRNFIGFGLNVVGAFGDPITVITPYNPQVNFDQAEPFLISVANDSRVEGNILRNNWTGGITLGGNRNIVRGNVIEDIAGSAISCFIEKANNAGYISDGGALNDAHIIYHYMAGQYPDYKGIDLGTVNVLDDGNFYGTGMTDEELKTKWTPIDGYNNYDNSVNRYYCMFNKIENNIIRRFALGAIHLENSIATTIRGNVIENGIPLLTYPSLPFAVTDGTILNSGGLNAIDKDSDSMDWVVEDNEIIIVEPSQIPISLTEKQQYSWLKDNVFKNPVTGELDFPLIYTQDYLIESKIQRNNVRCLDDINGNTKTLKQIGGDNFWATRYPTVLDSVSLGDLDVVLDSFQSNVQELEIDHSPIQAHILAAFKGKFNIYNPMAVGNLPNTAEYFALVPTGGAIGTLGVYQATKGRNFRFFLLRRDIDWRLSYEMSVIKRDDAAFRATIKGEIYFRYSETEIERYDHKIESLDFSSGVFEFVPCFEEITPNNIPFRQLENKVLPNIYRGGIQVYFTPYDPLLYGWRLDGTWNIDENLIFSTKGEITQC